MVVASPVNKQISSEVILQLLESSVKGLPTIIPWTEQQYKLYLYPDGDSLWAACPDTGFCGDTIDILKEYYGINNVDVLITKLIRQGILPRDLKHESVDKYKKIRRDGESAIELLSHARERAKNREGSMLVPIAWKIDPTNERLWSSFSKHVGLCTDVMYYEAFGSKPKIKLRNAVVVPFYDMPGRISFLRFFIKGRGRVATLDKVITNAYGIAMAADLPFNPRRTVVVDRVDTALKLNYNYFKELSKQAPLICIEPGTPYCPLEQSKLVFLTDPSNGAIFKNTRAVLGCSLAILDDREWVKARHANQILDKAIACATSWEVAFKDRLLYLYQVDKPMAEYEVDSMELTDADKGKLLYACTPEERNVIKTLFSDDVSKLVCFVDGDEIHLKENEWFVKNLKSFKSICNFPFQIKKVVAYGYNKFYQIEVHYKNKVVDVLAPIDRFTKNPGRFIRDFIVTEGVGIPHVSSNWTARLLRISTEMYGDCSDYEDRDVVLGWQSSGDFNLPKLRISGGRIYKGNADQIPVKGLPYRKASGQPVERLVSSLCIGGNYNENIWAYFFGMAHNILAEYFKLPTKSIMFSGSSNTFGLMPRVFEQALVSAEVKLPGSTLPVSMHKTVLDQPAELLHDVGSRGVMVYATQFVDAAFKMRWARDWMFIKLGEPGGMIDTTYNYQDLIVAFVQVIQNTKGFSLSAREGVDSIAMTYIALEQFVNSVTISADTRVLSKMYESVYKTGTPQTEVIKTVYNAVKSGHLRIGGAVQYNDKFVMVNREAFENLPTAGRRLFNFNMDELRTDDFAATGEAIFIRRKLWDGLQM